MDKTLYASLVSYTIGKGSEEPLHQEIRNLLFILDFSLEKFGILISYQSQSVVRPCVRLALGTRSNNDFLVNASSPKPLDIATSKFACAYVT